MSDLSPEAAVLMRAGRAAFRPDATDRDRVLQSLAGVLGENLDGAKDGSPANATGPSHVALRSWFLGGLGVVAVGAGMIVTSHPRATTAPAVEPVRSHSVETRAPAAPPALAPSPIAAVDPAPAATAAGVSRSDSRTAPRAGTDSLSEEVRLLSRAEQQMNDGLADDALRTLADHERRFPSGALAEERMAARVQALCALGRTAEAKNDLAKLARAYPRSAHLERARRVCGAQLGSTP